MNYDGKLQFVCDHAGGSFDPDCPKGMPEDGTACAVGGQCHYPFRVTCLCENEGGADHWKCYPPYEPIANPGPQDINPDTLVEFLTDGEVQAWCQWYVGLLDECHISSGASNEEVFGACISKLTLEQCMSSLRKKPCGAKVSELNDCFLTMCARGPNPFGCGRYLRNPECRGVIVDLPMGAEGNIGPDAGEPPCDILY